MRQIAISLRRHGEDRPQLLTVVDGTMSAEGFLRIAFDDNASENIEPFGAPARALDTGKPALVLRNADGEGCEFYLATHIPPYQREFPDFDPATMPLIPEGFDDTSWGNDLCPSFVREDLGLVIFIEHADPSKREFPEIKRFTLGVWDNGSTGETLCTTDNWPELLMAIVRAANDTARAAATMAVPAELEAHRDLCLDHWSPAVFGEVVSTITLAEQRRPKTGPHELPFTALQAVNERFALFPDAMRACVENMNIPIANRALGTIGGPMIISVGPDHLRVHG